MVSECCCMGQLNASNDSLELGIYTGLLIQQHFRATKAVHLVTGAGSFLFLLSGGCMPAIPHSMGEIQSFSAEMDRQGVFHFSQPQEKPKKTKHKLGFDLPITTAWICFSSYTDCTVGGCCCLSNSFEMESFRKKGKKSAHSPAFVISFQGFGIISLCVCCAV